MSPEKLLIGSIVLLFVLIAGAGYFDQRQRNECRKQGLDANKTVDEIVKLCNLPGRK